MSGREFNSLGSTDAALAAFDQSPSILGLCEGPELVVVALNITARRACGDRLGEPAEEVFAEFLGAPLLAQLPEVYASGRRFEDNGWRQDVCWNVTMTPYLATDGSVRGVVIEAIEVTDVMAERPFPRVPAALDLHAALQDAILPQGLPILPQLDLAARYLLAEAGTSAGGDWFDAIVVPGGSVALVVGDVVGHGVRSSVVMGQLKAILGERLRADGDLVGALQAVDRRAGWVPEARSTTLCVALIDPATGLVCYCTAGHPPPLVIDRSGVSTYLPATGAGPLGSGLPFSLGETHLGTEDLLLLYSDGLVERPGRSTGQNTLDLARVAGDSRREVRRQDDESQRAVEHVCSTVLEQLTAMTGYDDDITVVAAQRTRPVVPVDLELPASPTSLRVVRRTLNDWLSGLGVGRFDEMALQHAAGELVSNAVEHAYVDLGGEGVVEVRLALTPEAMIEVEIRDHGRWRPAQHAAGRGRGLAMARGFADALDLRHDDAGTWGRLRFRALRPVPLLTSSVATPQLPAPRRDALGFRQAEGMLALSGTIDQVSSDEVRRRLAHASHGGTTDLIVDLNGVTLLASAGVQVLYDVMSSPTDGQPKFHLVASMGTPAQHVLEMVRLPYTSDLGEEG